MATFELNLSSKRVAPCGGRKILREIFLVPSPQAKRPSPQIYHSDLFGRMLLPFISRVQIGCPSTPIISSRLSDTSKLEAIPVKVPFAKKWPSLINMIRYASGYQSKETKKDNPINISIRKHRPSEASHRSRPPPSNAKFVVGTAEHLSPCLRRLISIEVYSRLTPLPVQLPPSAGAWNPLLGAL